MSLPLDRDGAAPDISIRMGEHMAPCEGEVSITILAALEQPNLPVRAGGHHRETVELLKAAA
jgi:hypothetical protein